MKQKMTNKDMNVRSLPIEQNQLRAVKNDDGTTTVSGTAIVFNQPSQPIPFIEYISRDALNDVDFSKTLLLYAHDYNKILARADSGTLTTKIDDLGLHFTAKLPDTTLANDVRKDIQAGNLKGCSFGFTIADGGDRYDTDSKGQTIHYVDKIDSVSELTITPIPAYTETSVQVQRDLNSYLKSKEDKNMSEKKTQEQQNEEELDEKIKKAVREAVQCLSKQKRDDEDADDVADDGVDVDEEDDASSSVAASSTASSSTSSAVQSSASSTASSSVQSSASSQSRENQKSKEEKREMINITPENSKQSDKQELRDFAHFLVTREMRPSLQREAAAQGVGLTQGSVLIPESILAPLHEEHQFNRLENFTHNVNVTTTTGKQPYFQENTGVLQTKEEFDHAKDVSLSNLKFINWVLKTYAGKLALSREVLMDSEKGSPENWVAEAQAQMNDLKDNTNDSLIATQLLNGATTKNATDAVSDMKTILNVNLQPKDSEASQIILTASAYNALDQLKDGFGRPLLQPDPTQASSNLLFGKPVIKVADTLLGKAGDAIAVIAPLNKVIYNFTMGQVSGQFIDNFDIFDTTLGVFIRKDVVNARPDLVNVLKLTDKSLAASSGVGAH
ncbi:phage major capsid protein [Limosilactobacillus reuteri]|uniref:phage major capsid protein n=1 Tax=Limosilactobacillus reuteri TaxID=1598 RepID=UPI00235F5158|nr:phage major capsid protein [Limosilactobacillus reuteri]MDD1400986.1 phage major capsid protein [Limosilactobacillus reuteri]